MSDPKIARCACTYHLSCKLTWPLSRAAFVLLSACFTTQERWQKPELPRQEQHPLISGCPSSSCPSSWQIQQNDVSVLSVLVVPIESDWATSLQGDMSAVMDSFRMPRCWSMVLNADGELARGRCWLWLQPMMDPRYEIYMKLVSIQLQIGFRCCKLVQVQTMRLEQTSCRLILYLLTAGDRHPAPNPPSQLQFLAARRLYLSWSLTLKCSFYRAFLARLSDIQESLQCGNTTSILFLTIH